MEALEEWSQEALEDPITNIPSDAVLRKVSVIPIAPPPPPVAPPPPPPMPSTTLKPIRIPTSLDESLQKAPPPSNGQPPSFRDTLQDDLTKAILARSPSMSSVRTTATTATTATTSMQDAIRAKFDASGALVLKKTTVQRSPGGSYLFVPW